MERLVLQQLKEWKERKDRKDGKVNLISDMLNKHSGSGNTQRDKPKREREDRGPSI